MANGHIESVENVNKYLREVKSILCSERFNIDTDLEVLMGRRKNIATIIALNYTKSDLRDALLSLTVKDYLETLPDTMDETSPSLYVFCKNIQTSEVYIKIKIRDSGSRQIFCLSFHYAEFPTFKPYSV